MNTYEITKAYFEEKEIVHTANDEEQELTVHFGSLQNLDRLDVSLFFDKEEGRYVETVVRGLCKVPDDKIDNILYTVNKLNDEYRWLKFILTKQNRVNVRTDLILTPETCSDFCEEIIYRTARICEEVYPEFMKAIWG